MWNNRLTSRRTRRDHPRPRGRTACRPHLEELEARRLLTVTFQIVNGVLMVNCSGQNVVTVDHVGQTTIINNTGFGDETFDSIQINGGGAGTTENLHATVKPITVFNANLDTVNVGDLSGSVQGIQATLTLENPPSFNTINIDDRADPVFRTVTFDSSTLRGGDNIFGILTGLAPAPITYEYFDAFGVTVRTGTGGASVQVLSYQDNYNVSSLHLIGNGAGLNMLIGTNAANTFTVTGTNTGSLTSPALLVPVSFAEFQNLTGGGANNTFVFNSGGSISGNVVGGGGTNTLNYANFSGNVIVDLVTSTATAVGGTVTHLQNAVGASGGGANGLYDIFVGNGGNVFTGGSSRRNLLIAGASASTLLGGNDDDILIGGTTAYDADVGALTAVMAEWTRTDEDYATRVDHLLTGTNSPVLDATTVTGNGGGNTLTGDGGNNLFYGSLTGDTTDRRPDEFFIVV